MLVYRIETSKNRRGVYATACMPRCCPKQHPTPDGDALLREWWYSRTTEDWYFGFDSLAALHAWFEDDMLTAIIYENRARPSDDLLVIAVYDVRPEHYKLGEKQCVFQRDMAHKVDEYSLENVPKEEQYADRNLQVRMRHSERPEPPPYRFLEYRVRPQSGSPASIRYRI